MRRHQLDPVSLVFGFAFTAAGLLFVAGRIEQAVRLRWLWPLLLLALGLGILLDLSTRRPEETADAEAGEAPGTPTHADDAPSAAGGAAPPVAPEPAADAEPPAPEEATRTAELDREDAPPERDR